MDNLFSASNQLNNVIAKCRCALHTVRALALVLCASPSLAATTIGATPGSYQVSPSGAFTYSIPIGIPPGTAGVEPKLSLTYNSQGGNGLVGMGWSLAGLSVIHRCPKSVAQDGVLGGVNYDANDRYCLDGQRLIATRGTYGGNGAEYRTETESYSRIISYGSQGSGPANWKVWTPSGQIIEYGNTADSRIEAQGKSEVMLWSLNKLSDTVSNYHTVSYIEDNPNGQFYPDRIDYTGNSVTGKSPSNSVRFIYEVRPDVTPLYQSGSLNKTTVRLKNVQTYTGTVLVRDYQLAYEQSASTQRSRLGSLTECEGNGVCLQGTSLNWSIITNGFDTQTWTVPNAWGGSGYTWAGDFNGDGKTDIASANGGSIYVHLSTGSGFDNQTWTVPSAWGGSGYTWAGDFNGDGKTDIASANGGSIYVHLSMNNMLTDVLNSLSTGLGASTSVTYKPLTDPTVYSKDNAAVYPYLDVQAPLYVVSSVSTSDGIGGSHVTNYSYTGAKSHQLGGGFLGFRQVDSHDPQARIRSTTTYRQDYPYQGQPLGTQKRTDSNVLLGQSLITHTDELRDVLLSPIWHRSLPTRTVESSYELTGGLIGSTITDSQYDAYGNPTSIVVNTGGGYSKTTTNTYDNIIDANRWFLGRLLRSTVNSVTP